MPFVIALLVAWILRPLSKLFKRTFKKRQKLAVLLSIAAVILFYLIIGTLLLLVAAQGYKRNCGFRLRDIRAFIPRPLSGHERVFRQD
jgi:hypothetical protein